MTDLGGSQISTLLETLPGIANVLRSPVADALVNVIRAAARLSEFDAADAEELIRYSTRRGLLGAEEGDRLLVDVQAAEQRRADRAAERKTKATKPRTSVVARAKAGAGPVAKAKPKPKPKPAAKAAPKSAARPKSKSKAAAHKKAAPRSKRR